MRFSKRRIIYLCLAAFAIFIIGGGLDFTYAFIHGGNVPLANPTLSAFSPVAIMLYGLGFTGLILIYHGATILETDTKLGKKQVEAGFIMLYFIMILLEILYRLALNL